MLRRRVVVLSWRIATLRGALCTILFAMPVTGHAEGLFDFLFGGFRARPAQPAPVNAYAPTSVPVAPAPLGAETVHPGGGGTGRTVAFCVRLCDGESFPMEHFANATPIETCRAMCPASKTKVFFGTEIDHAVARDGARYADLDNAFVYRKHLVANCTCNGRDAFGLAPFEMASDPTLRPGDIVVTKDGLVAFTGKRGQAAAYTPVDPKTISDEINSVTAAPRVVQRMEPPNRERMGTIVESRNTQPQYLPPLVDLRGQDAR